MKVIKVINNNVVTSTDDSDREVVVMGKGIGFQAKPGSDIPDDKVEKVYHLKNDEQHERFLQLAEEIPYEHLSLATEIITETNERLGQTLSRSLYITLTDHLNFAIERFKQGIAFENALDWELERYYAREYSAGQNALDIVERRLGIRLPDSEAGFIAMHIINGEIGGMASDISVIPELVKESINIVRYTLMIDFDECSVSYHRFVQHLKNLAVVAIAKLEEDPEGDSSILDSTKEHYPEEYACAEKIKDFIFQKTGYTVAMEETVYLTMLINRVKRRQ